MPASPGSEEYGDPDTNPRFCIMSRGFTIRIEAPDGRLLTDEQFAKAGIGILLSQWNPPWGTA